MKTFAWGLLLVFVTAWAYLGAWNGLTSGELWEVVIGIAYVPLALIYTLIIGWLFERAAADHEE